MITGFQFSPGGLKARERWFQRFFEILPGLTSWTILGGLVFLSLFNSLLAAIIMIAFYFYWLLRLFYMTIFLLIAYVRLSFERTTDWMLRVREVDGLESDFESWRQGDSKSDLGKIISLWIHERNLEILEGSASPPPSATAAPPFSKDIYHLVIIPIAKERRNVFEPGVQSFASGQFPSRRIVVALALEERASQEIKRDAHEVQQKYKSAFYDFLIVNHPDGLPGEARVKGANAAYAARYAADYFRQKNIPADNIVVSCFDADTVVGPDYFACLTYHFMITPDRTRASFQPIPVYHNNIWKVRSFARVLEIGSSFFQLIEATNPEKLVTFSSHSMSFKALTEAGFWPVDMISDDSAIFWKAFLHFEGHYRVIPMYVTISMDVVDAGSWWKTIIDVYKQKRRWAWGVENFAPVMRGFLKRSQIPFSKKLELGFKLFSMHISWATWGFLLTVIGWLPALFAGREFSSTVLYYSAPRITGIIFNLALLALVASMMLSLFLLPKPKIQHPLPARIILVFEWFLVPLIISFLGALPALDAQTRLMFGRYMAFWVADKKRDAKKHRTMPVNA